MTSEKIKRLLNTAGSNFFILHIEELLSCDLSDPDVKNRKISEYFREQHGFVSKDEYGIRMRINAVFRIIEAGAVNEAIEMINPDDPRILPEARNKVLELKVRI